MTSAITWEPGGLLRGASGAAQAHFLRVTGPESRPLLERSFRLAFRLPARLWAAGVDTLEVHVDGTLVAIWRRMNLPGELDTLLARGTPADDLVALDLARQPGLRRVLPPATLARLSAVAAAEGLDDLFPPAANPPSAPVVAPLAGRQDIHAYAAARQADPRRDPILIFDELPGGGQDEDWSPLQVAEDMMAAGRLEAFVAHVAARGLRLPVPAPGNDWRNITLLPFLLHSDEPADIDRALWNLEHARGGWLLAGLLGWVGEALATRLAAEDPDLPRALARFSQWQRIVEAEAANPWGQGAHEGLIDAVLRLVDRRHHLPPDCAEGLTGMALSCFGLSPRFWTGIARLQDPGETLATHCAAFAALQDWLETPGSNPEAARAALDGFTAAGVLGVDAFRREGALASPVIAGPSGDALLRRYAAPGAPAVPAEQVKTLRRLTGGAAQPDPVAAVCARARELIAGRLDPEVFAAELAALDPDTAQALGRACVEALLHAGRVTAARGLARVTAQPLPGWRSAIARRWQRPPTPLARLHAGANPLYDTLVVVRTPVPGGPCLPWLDDLIALGIPAIRVSAGGSTEFRDRHLTLAAAPGDDADLLLALLGWAAEGPFERIAVVDDQTILDAAAIFDAWPWRHSGVAGFAAPVMPDFRRPAAIGDPIDTAPAEAGVLDIGLGVILTRAAMRSLLTAATRSTDLVAGRRSADRLLAGLAQIAGLSVHPPGPAGLRARPGMGADAALPVPLKGGEGFHPGPASGAVASYPAGPASLAGLQPARIWPSTLPASASSDSHPMILLAGHSCLEVVRTAPVAVAAVMRNERAILPHFLNHYRKLGAGGFLFVDNGSEDGSVEFLAAQPDVCLFAAAAPFREAVQGTEWKRALMALRPGGWTLVADVDEFLVAPGLSGPAHPQGWDGSPDLPTLVRQAQGRGQDAFRILMLDLYPEGPLAAADLSRAPSPFDIAPLADFPPWRADWFDRGVYGGHSPLRGTLRHRLFPDSTPDMFVSEKVALIRHRPWMRFSVSLHHAAECAFAPEPLVFAHFKYTSEFPARIQREVRRGQYFNNAAEYRRYAALISEQRASLDAPGVSVPWREALEGWLQEELMSLKLK